MANVFIGDILAGDSQGSIFRQFFLTLSYVSSFWIKEVIISLSRWTTPYVVCDNTTDALNSLTNITQELFTGFASNQMKTNYDKCNLLLST